jgi:type IV pilus biogenesis protein PilP
MRSEGSRVSTRISSAILMMSSVLGWPLICLAASTDAPPAVSTSGAESPASPTRVAATELMQLQEDTVVLKAQLRKLDAQAQVAEREAALDQLGRTGADGRIAVLATQSFGGATSATLQADDGSELDVQVGDALPNGMRVVAIRPGAVVVETREHRRVSVSVVTPRSSATRLATANPQGGVPPIPTLPPLPSTAR